MIVGLRGMTAEEDVAVVMNRFHFDTCFGQQRVGITSRSAPERIEPNAQSCLLDHGEIDQLFQSVEIHPAGIKRLRRYFRILNCWRGVAQTSNLRLNFFVTSGRAGAPSGVENLMPLYSGGLWDAVKFSAPSAPDRI